MRYHREQKRIPGLDSGRGPILRSETAIHERQPIIALVERSMRQRMEAGVEGNGSIIHISSFSEALSRAEAAPASVVLISSQVLHGQDPRTVRKLAAISRVVALFNGEQDDPTRLLELGARGLREAVNLRVCEGWQHLRQILQDEMDPVANRIATVVLPHLEGAAPGTRRFFGTVVRSARTMRTARTLSIRLGIAPSTLASRFHRAALPSPKILLSSIRLLFAKALLDDERRSMSSVANELRYSSPQAFSRHVRHLLGVSLRDLRRDVTFDSLVGHFVENLIVHHLPAFRLFDPFASFGAVHAVSPEEGNRYLIQ